MSGAILWGVTWKYFEVFKIEVQYDSVKNPLLSKMTRVDFSWMTLKVLRHELNQITSY